jgi:hypothetical protein
LSFLGLVSHFVRPVGLVPPERRWSLSNRTCLGNVRRVILDHLGNRYHRRFDTHRDFVRYAQEQRLNLDLTTPPQRRDPKLTPLFEP